MRVLCNALPPARKDYANVGPCRLDHGHLGSHLANGARWVSPLPRRQSDEPERPVDDTGFAPGCKL